MWIVKLSFNITGRLVLLSSLILILFCFQLKAQDQLYRNIYLKQGKILAHNNVDIWQTKSQNGAVKYPVQVLLQFDKQPSKEQISILSSAGVSFESYIPDNTYLVIINVELPHHVFEDADIVFVTEVKDGWKQSADLIEYISSSKGKVEVCVAFHKSIPEDEIEAFVEGINGVVEKNDFETLGYYNIRLAKREVLKLINWYGTSYVSPSYDDVPLNIIAKSITSIQRGYSPIINGGYGLRGEGVSVGVGDNTSGIFHVDLMDRVVNYTPAGYTNHGVHINGIVGGAGIIDPRGEGMATHALLSDHFFSQVLTATPAIREKHQVNVTNNSYSAAYGSCEYAGTYDQLSAGLDNLCIVYNDVLQVFAAANDGNFDCPPYPKGFATIAGGYQVAKNNIVVTSTDKEYVNAWNASRGPVRDGRLKPEITAVGVDVNSTTKSEDYLVASGTSMACPQVAAAAALLTQRYKQLNSNTLPRADVLKALLINGSTDIGNKGPDFRFGFGFLNLYRSLIILDSNRYRTGYLQNGTSDQFSVTVPPNTSKLKVFLCWHDPAASPMASKQLVNDLDLEVSEPNNKLHYPLVLDASPNNMNNLAVEKADRFNNSEQVVIDNPSTGNYTINVKAFSVTSNGQAYVVAYDFVPQGIDIKYPIKGAQVKADDSIYIYWDAPEGANTFKIEYSDDNGNNWNNIDASVPADRRFYKWFVPDFISSGKCLIRISRNNTSEQSTTGLFIINKQPQLRLGDVQCPGYISIVWNSIIDAGAYEVMRKVGGHMEVVATTSDTSYIFNGLSFDSTYYISVRPVIDGLSGYRALAIKRQPNTGDCSGTISDGDLMLVQIVSPNSGRQLTSSALGSSEVVKLRVRNLDDAACDSFMIGYQVNGGTIITQKYTSAIAAQGSLDVSFTATVDMSATQQYNFKTFVSNLTVPDPVNKNDSLVRVVRSIANPQVLLEYISDFESLPVFSTSTDTLGLGDSLRWDYINLSDTGRLRSHVLNTVTISGARSMSMDAYKSTASCQNQLLGTFNMSNYNASTEEVRFEFDYILHGVPKSPTGNFVQVRGADDKPYKVLYNYDLDAKSVGRIRNSGSLSLSDAMLNNSDVFSTSTQVSFYQNDTSVIGDRNYGNGLTIDNVRLYTVQNDIQLVEVKAPVASSCGISGPVPLTIAIRNGVNKALYNIILNYRLDDGNIVSETLSSIEAKKFLDYTFSKLLDISKFGTHKLDIWISVAGDTYTDNDSILNHTVRNQPLVSIFPYVEGFEQNDGHWYADGINPSWQWGKPEGPEIDKAASGTNAWVTNLKGHYKDNELSYLYSPCFDITSLNNPTLSFQASFDIEDCGAILCDEAFIEFTEDGTTWTRLRNNGGTNWYNDTNFLAWTWENKTIWQPISNVLPDSISNIQFRFVLRTDPGSTREGWGIDDVSIYDDVLYEGTNDIISISPNPTFDGKVTIEWAANNGTQMQVLMSDLSGRDVFRNNYTAQQGYNKTVINTPFMSGVYFIKLIIGDKEHLRKIVCIRR